MVKKIGMNYFIYELFHVYLKCFVSFYGMVNFLGEEKNCLYKTNVAETYWNETLHLPAVEILELYLPATLCMCWQINLIWGQFLL
jgi:hypothetical protein